jgi:hypothetical protein
MNTQVLDLVGRASRPCEQLSEHPYELRDAGHGAPFDSSMFVVKRGPDLEVHVWAHAGDTDPAIIVAEYVPSAGAYVHHTSIPLDHRSSAELAGFVLRTTG